MGTAPRLAQTVVALLLEEVFVEKWPERMLKSDRSVSLGFWDTLNPRVRSHLGITC